MSKFNGFTSSETFTPIPDSFVRQLLNEIEDADELKASLYAIWRIEHQEGAVRFLKRDAFAESATGVDKAVSRGTLLRVQTEAGEFILLNNPRGRASAEAIQGGQVDPASIHHLSPVEHPNIFQLYEENIGALTPLIADMLREAEKEYPDVWFKEAFEIAVAKNARHWKFVEAVLKRWKDKGKDERKDQQDLVKDAKRYTDSDFSEFINQD